MFSDFANRAAAVVMASAMTAFLLVASFAYTPSAEVVAGMVA